MTDPQKYFSLKSPCGQCPFRTDRPFHLRTSRVVEICDSLMMGQSFPCHKTTEFDDDGACIPHDGERHCAGATIMLESMNKPNQIMRVAERIGLYDRRKMKLNAPVFTSARAMINHYKTMNRKGKI